MIQYHKLTAFLLAVCLSTATYAQRNKTYSQPGPETLKAGSFIDVNAASYAQSSYTPAQLVTNVLLSNGGCSTPNVSNVQVSPNLAASDNNRSWGYFNKANTAFPFNAGVILTTGYARKAGNSFISATLGDNIPSGGDADLAAALGIPPADLKDATYLSFSFVPTSTTISFRYIFASEEYEGYYPCSFTDGFALLLKKQGDPNYTNLAVLPGGAGPVSVTNIHPSISFGGGCAAINQQYFAGYNTAAIETNFNGRTVPLTATATVIPGQTYQFKMVIADFQDNNYDTGVFLEAGSFNIGVTITDGNGVSLPASTAVCAGSSQVLAVGGAPAGSTYTWTLNGTPIPGATAATYTATQPGTYAVQVTVPGNSCPATAQVVITSLPSPTVQNASLSACANGSAGVFNLPSAQPNISTTPGATFSYYTNLADATAGNSNTISNPTAYTSAGGTVYVLVKTGTCSKIANLQLNLLPVPATPVITASSPTICYGGSAVLTSNNATGNTWSNGATTQTITVSAPGTYSVTNTTGNCTSPPASITINGETNPGLVIQGNTTFCQGSSTTLTASASGTGNTFTWSNGTNGAVNTVTAAGTYIVTMQTPAGCQYQQSITVTADPPVNAQNASLNECSPNATATFNLTSAQTAISSTAGNTFSYYLSAADAAAGNGNTIPNPTTFTTGNTTVYVRVTNGTCHKVVNLQLSVTQNATPVITASATKICGSGSVTLSSSFATGNTWSTGQTSQSITVTTPGTYSVTNTSGNCTGAPATVTITGDPDPNIQITGSTVICGNPVTLTANSTGQVSSYSWSNGSTGPTVTAATPGVYTVTATTPAGCQFQKSVTVAAGVVPVVQNSSLQLCSTTGTAIFNLTSAQAAISTTPGTTFTFYQNLADATAQNGMFISNPSAFNSGSATVYVLVKTATCSAIAELQLTVIATPTPVITASSPSICAGAPVTLTSNYATGNVWSTGQTTQSIIVTNPGTYTLTVSNGNCNSSTVSVNITATPNPNLQISGNLTFCQGSSTLLTASAAGTGNSFVWSNGTTGAVNTVTTGGIQTVTVTTASGCQFQQSVTVNMDPQIFINIATPGEINCTNSQVTLNASNSIYQPGAVFSWTATGGGIIVSGANTLTPVVSAAGTYTLTITSATPMGCSTSQSVTVIKNITPPTISVSAPATTICLGDSILLTASGAATYTWGGLTGTGNMQTLSPTATTTYTVTGTGANGCAATTPATITINVVPAIKSTLTNGSMCQGDQLTLDAGTGPNYTYLWNNGATTQTITVTTPGIYSVTISNGTCSKTFNSTVTYTVVPQIKEITFENNTLTITASNPGTTPLEYSLDNGFTWQTSNVYTNVPNNVHYTVLVRNKNVSCFGSADYFTFFMPNFITPNHDGQNDTVSFTDVINYKGFGGSIFDRYGRSVFTPVKSKSVWDGYYLNRPLPTGTYWYKFFWMDALSNKPIEKSGWILLKNRE